jgi:hypothetical protein
MLNESPAPLADGGLGPALSAGDARVAFALGRPQHQLGPTNQIMGKCVGVGKATQLNALFVGQRDRGLNT